MPRIRTFSDLYDYIESHIWFTISSHLY
jgi:hypothetical protein